MSLHSCESTNFTNLEKLYLRNERKPRGFTDARAKTADAARAWPKKITLKWRMTTQIYRPRSWEELYSIEGFDREPIAQTVMIQGALRGDYEMEEKAGERPCGIENCHRLHRRGFVVVLPDGRKSNVGKDCGKTKFGAAWTRMRSDYTRLKRAQSKQAALEDLRGQLREIVESWPDLETARVRRARLILVAWDALPPALRTVIEARAADNDVRISVQRLETADEVRRREFRTNTSRTQPRMVSVDLGRLRGLNSLKAHLRVDALLDRIIPTILADAFRMANADEATTEALRDSLRTLADVQKKLEASLDHLDLFISADNLRLLSSVRAFQQQGVRRIAFEEHPNPAFRLDRP